MTERAEDDIYPMVSLEISARILVVGGHSRNIGKTCLVVDLIRAFPEAAWTAVKITQHSHGIPSIDGGNRGDTAEERVVVVEEEHDSSRRTDTSRFLAAGAARALWLRVKEDRLAKAVAVLLAELAQAKNVILESNSVVQFVRPTLHLVVLDPSQADFKPSAQRFLDRADAFLLRAPLGNESWRHMSGRLFEGKPCFYQALGEEFPGSLRGFVQKRFFGSPGSPTS